MLLMMSVCEVGNLKRASVYHGGSEEFQNFPPKQHGI